MILVSYFYTKKLVNFIIRNPLKKSDEGMRLGRIRH